MMAVSLRGFPDRKTAINIKTADMASNKTIGTGQEAPMHVMNMRATRNHNLSAVFEAIREGDGVSRTEIGRNMPFSLQTVTTLSQELIAMGLIQEGDRLQTRAKGKPHMALHIVPGRGYAIGIQIRWNSTTLCLVDLAYSKIEEKLYQIEPFPVTRYIDQIVGIIDDFRVRHRDKDIWALGVSAPLLAASRAMLDAYPSTIEWKDGEWFGALWQTHSTASLRETLQQRTGLPVTMLNNPQSAAIAEAMFSPAAARMVYIMVGLSLGAAFVNKRELNQELWRNAGEIGYIVYRDRPLNSVLSVSGLREHLGLTAPQGQYESLVERALTERRDELEIWFAAAAERLLLVANFLENTMRPDGIVLGGFLPPAYIAELVRRVMPLPDSIVPDQGATSRILPRLAAARHSVESIPYGAAIAPLSSRANARFSELLGQRRSN